MELLRDTLEDNSEYGKKRLATFLKIKDYYDTYSMGGKEDITDIIDSNFKETKPYSLGRMVFQLKSLKKDLETSDNAGSIKDFTNWLNSTIQEFNKMTLDKTNLKDNQHFSIVSATNAEGIFNVKLRLKDIPASVDVLEHTDGSKDAFVAVVDDTTGSKTTFSVEDEGDLYDAIQERLSSELKRMSMSEGYKRGQIVKDYNNNHFKVTKVEDKHYRVKNYAGGRLFVEKEGFESITKKTRKRIIPEVEKYIKNTKFKRVNETDFGQNMQAGTAVNTPNSKGKVAKTDNKGNVWVELDTDTTIDGVKYTKGSQVVYQNKSVAKESVEYKVPRDAYLLKGAMKKV